MLVLTVKQDGKVYVDLGGESVEIQFLGPRKGGFGLGFRAPKSVRIRREKVLQNDQVGK